MQRLLVLVEGQTEETFVNDLLRPHLQGCGFASVSARLMGNARLRNRRGGVRKWPASQDDLLDHLAGDRTAILGLMVDYYAMPAAGDGEWPGRRSAARLPMPRRGRAVEEAIAEEVRSAMGPSFDARRFVPYVVMHEFEGLLFSDCMSFAQAMGRPHLAPRLQEIRDQFRTPEEIDDSPETAPSKRVEAVMWGYDKPLFGSLAARRIGLATIARECENFGHWLNRLETLGRIP
jgi:hypothetical protein